jgi:hypothetical protein
MCGVDLLITTKKALEDSCNSLSTQMQALTQTAKSLLCYLDAVPRHRFSHHVLTPSSEENCVPSGKSINSPDGKCSAVSQEKESHLNTIGVPTFLRSLSRY